MLAGHVEAELARDLDIGPERFVGGRRIKSVRPKALVQRPDHEQRLVVEEDAGDALVVFRHGNLAHAKVAFDRVDVFTRGGQLHAQMIKMRRVGRPQFRLLDRQFDRRAGLAGSLGDRGFAVGRDDVDGRIGGRARAGNRDRHAGRFCVDIRNDGDRFDRRFRYWFQPNGLPDAGGGRIEDSAGVRDLLAARLRAGVDRVPSRDDEFLFAVGLEGLGDVEGKVIVAAAMLAQRLPVDPDRRLKVDGSEMEQQPLPVPLLVQLKRAADTTGGSAHRPVSSRPTMPTR